MQVPILRSTHKILSDQIASLKKEIEGNSKDIGAAAALGDLKENSAYHSARERQILLLEKMQRFTAYSRGRIIDLTETHPQRVMFGTCVTVVDLDSKEEHRFNIVGPVEYELDLLPDMVTFSAPMAKLLMTKQVGDRIDVRFGSNAWSGEITEIRAIEIGG